MKQIIIHSPTTSTDSVHLLKDLEFTITCQEVGKRETMASGRLVMDVVGVRKVLTIPTGYLSKSDLRTLESWINRYHVLKVSYPTVKGDVTEDFIFNPLTLKSFKYDDNGVDMWYGVTLTATSVEVSKS